MVLSVKNSEMNVGGQAVIEGVMMRAPKWLAIAVRRPDGEIFIKEDRWLSLSEKWAFLRWPFVRGSLVVLESLVNGVQALTFSANQALEEDEESLGNWALFCTVLLGLGAGILLFVVLPHIISGLVGRLFGAQLGIEDFLFHLIDGVVKMIIFLGYIWLISLFKDIRRVFEYHGAEHKSVYAYEAGEALTVENAKRFSTLHPRCGTAFILVVLLMSILFFAVVFPFVPVLHGFTGFMKQVTAIFMKVLFIFPIAGLAYEIIKFSSRNMDRGLVRLAVLPGLWMQKLTTREPGDDQLEVALAALRRVVEGQSRAAGSIV
ncbi:MAG: DUF1385 domain-containing protein [Deltaproteobacteria bacterium]|nr:DUF1385 domain-containing protein [Deltaproteobacteria bacterium]